MKQNSVSIFVTTYNWPEALSVCLQSMMEQTVLPDEIIVADDGSTDDTKQVVEKFQREFKVPIKHIWIEDKGYRINVIRNLSIKAAEYPFIIQIDGDVILDKNFIKDHLKLAKKNRFNIGRRVRIDKKLTNQICKSGDFKKLSSFRNYFICLLHHYLFYSSKTVRGLRGCNVAYWKSDALAVNGYNEDMIGKGPEDKEFGARVLNTGVKGFNLRNYAICYHLDHDDGERVVDYKKLTDMYRYAVENKVTQIPNGINKDLIQAKR